MDIEQNRIELKPSWPLVPLRERNLLQAELLKLICQVQEGEHSQDQINCVSDYLKRFGDNIDQLEPDLIREFKNIMSNGAKPEDKLKVLNKIQDRLKDLDAEHG